MQVLSATKILTAWELGQSLSGEERASLLLSLADPGVRMDIWSQRTIGERNAALFAVRSKMFGQVASGHAKCPKCGERMDLTIDLPDIPQKSHSVDDIFTFVRDRTKIRFRLPTGEDLIRTSGCADIHQAFGAVLDACILEAEEDGQVIVWRSLPGDKQEALADYMGSCDPQAETMLKIACPACGHGWEQPFDIAGFVWEELKWHARRLLNEIHELACAYGWTETEILTLTPGRRRAYLEMVVS